MTISRAERPVSDETAAYFFEVGGYELALLLLPADPRDAGRRRWALQNATYQTDHTVVWCGLIPTA